MLVLELRVGCGGDSAASVLPVREGRAGASQHRSLQHRKHQIPGSLQLTDTQVRQCDVIMNHSLEISIDGCMSI